MNDNPTCSAGRVLIVGCGDIGRRVAALESAAGNPVAALARSEANAADLSARAIQVIRGDLDVPPSLRDLPESAILYYFAPPPASGAGDPRLAALLRAWLPAKPPRRLVYISTSGVYGDCAGEWVDEERPPNPRTERAQRRLDAERQLLEFAARHDAAPVILRVPGIYGPGRLPLDRIRQGLPVVDPGAGGWSNRVHADDLAAACFAAARRGAAGRIYNISDGHPTTMADYFCRLADAHGLPRPPLVGLDEARRVLSPMMLSFLEESKRLVNRRMREELGVEPRYPDLAQGIAACLAAERGT